MATYTYSARTIGGDLQSGELQVQTRDEAMAFLRRQRLVPLKIEEKKGGAMLPFLGRASARATSSSSRASSPP